MDPHPLWTPLRVNGNGFEWDAGDVIHADDEATAKASYVSFAEYYVERAVFLCTRLLGLSGCCARIARKLPSHWLHLARKVRTVFADTGSGWKPFR